ncbi:hypothetical protein D3C81_1172160 [compost metagenome]
MLVQRLKCEQCNRVAASGDPRERAHLKLGCFEIQRDSWRLRLWQASLDAGSNTPVASTLLRQPIFLKQNSTDLHNVFLSKVQHL